MNKKEAIREACSIASLAFHSIGDYSAPNDGFCDRCPLAEKPEFFRNAGTALDYVRRAVVAQLKRDGHKIAEGFDAKTGKERTA